MPFEPTLTFKDFDIIEKSDGLKIINKKTGEEQTFKPDGTFDTDSLVGFEYIKEGDDLQARLDEYGDSPVVFWLSEGTFTAPTYGFKIYDNTILKGDRFRTTIEANAPGGTLTGADKYALVNVDNHEAGSGDWTGNSNIHIEGLTVRGHIRITADSAAYFPKNVTLRDLDCLDTDTWQVFIMGYEGVRIDNIHCENWNAGVDSGGNDGVHVIDCNRVTITGVHGHTGDDLVSIGIRNRSAYGIAVMGVHGQSEKANVVKLHGDTGALGQTLENVYVAGIWSDSCNHLISTDMVEGSVHHLTVDGGWVDSPANRGFTCASGDSHITLRNIHVNNSAGAGINMIGSNHLVEGCHLTGTQSVSAVGIDMKASDSVIRDCHISGFTGHAVAAQGVNTLVTGGYIDATAGARPVWPAVADVSVTDVTYVGGVPGPDNDGFLLDGLGEESAAADTPQYAWPRGALVDFIDTVDASGNGLYLIDRSQSPRKIA